MESSIEEQETSPHAQPPPTRTLLVAVPLDARASSQLLSWAVADARPDDTVLALHVLTSAATVAKEEKRSVLRQAKAFVISALGEFAGVCQTKQVKLEAKVRTSSSIGRRLTDEALLVKASFIVLGRSSRNSQKRNSFEIMNYCLKNAPEGCSIVGIDLQGLPTKAGDVDSSPCDIDHNNSSLSSRWPKAPSSPFHKLLGSISRREKRHSPSESTCEESPRAVLEGPDPGSSAAEDCSSQYCSSATITRRSRSSVWRRLSFAKLFFFPFPRPVEDLLAKDSDSCSSFADHDLKPSWRCFAYDEIARATNNFDAENLVGRGGFAEVFRGVLQSGQSVAVKRLAKGSGDQQKEKEFLMELGILGHVCHPNTANLIGCCIESGLHLVFDLSCNGTLASALHSKNGKILEWPIRYKIAIGVARGLHYLHKCCRHRIIHRDIKASNVLLGPDFEPQVECSKLKPLRSAPLRACPRGPPPNWNVPVNAQLCGTVKPLSPISDFGLAKWLPKHWTHHSVIPIEGTFGYLAPEYFMHGIVDEKTDVFAFGVLLLEIVTGRRPVDASKQGLLVWAKPLIEAGRIHELADRKLECKYEAAQLQRLVLTASYCVRQSPIWRPSMAEVLELLRNDHDSIEAQIWRIPESQADEKEDDDFAKAADCMLL